ncbi:MAG: hypothetical protein HY925_02800 [Elusimicrobia bacterium]|nr:hypothetical protein [Elusimicrobiota bacterium]
MRLSPASSSIGAASVAGAQVSAALSIHSIGAASSPGVAFPVSAAVPLAAAVPAAAAPAAAAPAIAVPAAAVAGAALARPIAAAADPSVLGHFASGVSQRDTNKDEQNVRRLYGESERGLAAADAVPGAEGVFASRPRLDVPSIGERPSAKAAAVGSAALPKSAPRTFTGNVFGDLYAAALVAAGGAVIGSLFVLSTPLVLAVPVAVAGVVLSAKGGYDRHAAVATVWWMPEKAAEETAAAGVRKARLTTIGGLAMLAAAAGLWAAGSTALVGLPLAAFGVAALVKARAALARSGRLGEKSATAPSVDERESARVDSEYYFRQATRPAGGGTALIGAGAAAAFGVPTAVAGAALGVLVSGWLLAALSFVAIAKAQEKKAARALLGKGGRIRRLSAVPGVVGVTVVDGADADEKELGVRAWEIVVSFVDQASLNRARAGKRVSKTIPGSSRWSGPYPVKLKVETRWESMLRRWTTGPR